MQSLTSRILELRGQRNLLDPHRPWLFLSEDEFSAAGCLQTTSTIFLTNRECPWKCVMCDLWKNTTTQSVPHGAIAEQIRHALQQLPPATNLKLYNSGSFFDSAAVSPAEWPAIAELIRSFGTVTVENHPQLCDHRCGEFRDLCGTTLEVAVGLETAHEPTLLRLNKRMDLDDYRRACDTLRRQQIRIRSFILLRPPWTSETEGIDRALQSLDFAFNHGADVCTVIPCRESGGMMAELRAAGEFSPPQIESLHRVLREALRWGRGRVFADLWDLAAAASPADQKWLLQLQRMNETQQPD